MKFSVAKEKLLEGLQQVQNVVSTRTTLPILSNVLLQANGNEVHLTTTDLDVGVRGSCEAEVKNRAPPRCRPAVSSTSCANCLRVKSRSMSMEKTPPPFEAAKAFSKSSDC